jgi:hypothetical protein
MGRDGEEDQNILSTPAAHASVILLSQGSSGIAADPLYWCRFPGNLE